MRKYFSLDEVCDGLIMQCKCSIVLGNQENFGTSDLEESELKSTKHSDSRLKIDIITKFTSYNLLEDMHVSSGNYNNERDCY